MNQSMIPLTLKWRLIDKIKLRNNQMKQVS